LFFLERVFSSHGFRYFLGEDERDDVVRRELDESLPTKKMEYGVEIVKEKTNKKSATARRRSMLIIFVSNSLHGVLFTGVNPR
jgi:hypothetical protein